MYRNHGINFRFPRSIGSGFVSSKIHEGQSNLTKQYGSETAQEQGGGFVDPATIAGVKGVFKGDNNTLGDPVNEWPNEIGGGASLTQATELNQPSLSTIGGRQAVDFDGSSDNMAGGKLNTYISADAAHGFIVLDLDDIAFDWFAPNNSRDAIICDTGGWWGIMLRQNGGIYYVDHYAYSGGEVYATATIPALGLNLIEWKLDGSNIHIKVNDGAFSSTACGAIGDISNTFAVAYSNYLNGRVGEIIIANTVLGASDVSDIRAWLADRWGVTI